MDTRTSASLLLDISPFSSSSCSSTMANKRPCPISQSQNPRFPILNHFDNLFHQFISLSDDNNPSSLIDLSFDRLLDSTTSDSEQTLLIGRALNLGSFILQAANRSARKRATKLNALVWPLPPDLTIKVFSMLDTQSLCYAAATCSMFNKCAMDPLCYANIDLTTVVPKVNNAVVSTMIQRAGKALRSLKLGIVPGPTFSPEPCEPLVYTIRNSVDASNFSWNEKKTRQGKESPILTRTCLSPLIGDGGAPGHVELRQILCSVGKNCHMIERLFFESSKTGRDDSLKSPTCVDLVNNCPQLASLSLRGFKLHDCKVRTLVKGFRKLRYADFSTSYSITGSFLRNLGNSSGGNLLEILILRDCMHLKETEVAWFLNAVLAGDFKFLKYVDISNREGLASENDWYNRCYSSSCIPMKQVAEERPDICLLAEFPSESFIEMEQMIDSDLNSDISLSPILNRHTSDSSPSIDSTESSYNSDQGGSNEDSQDSGYIIFEESSDEVEFPPV